MSQDATHPDRIKPESGNMISSGVMCLGNTSPDVQIKNEWRARSYQAVSANRDELVIATSNHVECSGDVRVMAACGTNSLASGSFEFHVGGDMPHQPIALVDHRRIDAAPAMGRRSIHHRLQIGQLFGILLD